MLDKQVAYLVFVVLWTARQRRQKMQRAARETAAITFSPRATTSLRTRPPRTQAAPKRQAKMEKMARYTATRPQIQSDFMKQSRGRVPRAPA